jgi:hypothetical protein
VILVHLAAEKRNFDRFVDLLQELTIEGLVDPRYSETADELEN